MESSKVLCQSLIKNLANTLKIPVHLFDTKGQLLLSHSNLNEKTNPLLTDHKLFLEILEKSASGEIELYFDGLIFYVALLKDDFIIIAGPILRSDETLSDKVILSAKKHVATPAPLARGKLEQVVNAMCLVYSALNGRECSAEKIMQFAFENLDNNLKELANTEGELEKPVEIRSDEDVKTQVLISVIDSVKNAGFTKLSIATEDQNKN